MATHKGLTAYQTPQSLTLKRTDHIWIRVKVYDEQGDWRWRWKCCTCGAVCQGEPPPYPTPLSWQAHYYEKLTAEQRAAAPFKDRPA